MQEKEIIYVHGASSTPVSFNYIKQNLPEHKIVDFRYDSNDDIDKIVLKLAEHLDNPGVDGRQYNIVAHSLGGVIATGATYIHEKHNIKMVAISSPFAGSKVASYLKWLYPGYGLFDNVSTTNPLILTIRHKGAIVHTLNIITNGGDSPLIKEKNDGVVSVNSQMSLLNSEKKIIELNHFEVLMSEKLVKEIKNFIWQ